MNANRICPTRTLKARDRSRHVRKRPRRRRFYLADSADTLTVWCTNAVSASASRQNPDEPPVLFHSYLGALLLAPLSTTAETAARPNILFIFADDQRADTLAALGNAHIQTPNLDRLVRRGVSFNRAYMQGGMNGATCVPSRAMLLSGRSLFHIDEELTRDETWPAAFGRAGYTTLHQREVAQTRRLGSPAASSGRQLFTGGMTNRLNATLSDLEKGNMGPAKLSPRARLRNLHRRNRRAFSAKPTPGRFSPTSPSTARTIRHIIAARLPDQYDPDQIPLPRNFLDQHPFNNGAMTIRDEQLLPWPTTPPTFGPCSPTTTRYISYLRSAHRPRPRCLDASPHTKNTIVVFAADSGRRPRQSRPHRQTGISTSTREMRVPLVVAGPGLPTNRTTDAMCYLYRRAADARPPRRQRRRGPGPAEGLDRRLHDYGQPAASG